MLRSRIGALIGGLFFGMLLVLMGMLLGTGIFFLVPALKYLFGG